MGLDSVSLNEIYEDNVCFKPFLEDIKKLSKKSIKAGFRSIVPIYQAQSF
jgi:hypothetical protein